VSTELVMNILDELSASQTVLLREALVGYSIRDPGDDLAQVPSYS